MKTKQDISDKSFKIWYVAITVILFALINLILINGVIKFGSWYKWIAIIINCSIVGMAAFRIVTLHLKITNK